MDKYVEWINGGIEVAKVLEQKSSMEIRKLKRQLREAQEYHDDLLLRFGINSNRKDLGVNMFPPDGQPSSPLFTALHPNDEELEEVPSYKKAKKNYAKELNISKPFVSRVKDTLSHQMYIRCVH